MIYGLYLSQQIAAYAVNQVLSGRNLTQALPSASSEFPHAMSQQRAAAQDLSYGTLRFYGEIDAYLGLLLTKPLKNWRVRCLLLIAIYQLLHDKAPAFTVVNQAVKAAGQSGLPWAKGFVNGVLRNFLRQKEALAKHVPGNEVAAYSYPQWWINKLKTQYPHDWQLILEAGNQHPPMVLRINQRRANADSYIRKAAEQELETRRISEYAVLLSKPLPVDRIPGFKEGMVSVQDYGAQFAAQLLDVHDNQRVLDACCAPGGKTGHILELANVEMVALDNDAERLQRTRSNLDRLALKATLLTGDAGRPDIWWDGLPFDRILADVPCSASGIVRRHVDIKWLRREADIVAFARQQAQILGSLWQVLAKGGKLLYVTCSVFHEENQGQIDQFLKDQADAVQLPLTLPVHMSSRDGQLIPCARHDGFFYALLQKN